VSGAARAFTLFPTALGRCGIAWSGDVVVATQLPEPDDARTELRLRQRAPGATPAESPETIRRAIAAIKELLETGRGDLSFVACDFGTLESLPAKVYAIARRIPPGVTRTYGEIAREIGDVTLSRLVGHALGRNPLPIVVPCHRVIGGDGRLTGFSANGGVATKLRMLQIERAMPADAPSLFADLPLATRP
jgi:methylated-DNA-[protein]-cysteine S-methyltransferase